MVDPVNKKVSDRPVSEEPKEIADYLNRELVPILKRVRLTLDALLARVTEGEGSPEGVVEADKGALYLRQDGAPGTFGYCKTTDSVATGWVAVF